MRTRAIRTTIAVIGEYDPKEYIPASKYDIEEMYAELKGMPKYLPRRGENELLAKQNEKDKRK